MSKKDIEAIQAALDKQNKAVRPSRKEARKLLMQLGMLTAGGNLKASFKRSKGVSR
ncbi:MAG: hypothetical protein QM802_22755 [Agriterribacter sp.]